jgi:hypothetical protein
MKPIDSDNFSLFPFPFFPMVRRNTIVTVLTGLVVGALLGAGAMQYASLTANMLVARTDDNYRSQRYNSTLDAEGIYRSDGLPGARSLDWATADTRTEKAPAAIHGAALEKQRYCPGQSSDRRSQCLINEVNNILEELKSNQ